MLCRLKLDGRITTASFCKGDLSIVTTRYVSSSYSSYLELFRPSLNEKPYALNYSRIFSQQIVEPVSSLVTFSQNSSPCEGLVSATTNGSLNFYTVDETCIRETYSCQSAHDGTILALDYCSKNNLLFSGGYDGALKIWDVRCFGEKGEALRVVPISSDRCCCITHCGTDDPYKVFVGTQKGTVCLYDTRVNQGFAVEKFSVSDSVSSIFSVATSILIVSTFDQVHKLNFLLARRYLLYQNDDTVVVGIGRLTESNQFSIADRTKRLLLVDYKSGAIEKNVVSKGKGYWTKVDWHSLLPVYLATSYKSLEIGLFPPAASSVSYLP